MKTPGVILAAFIVIPVVLVSLYTQGIIWPVYPDRDVYPIKGLDVSHHQGEIDWHKVGQGQGVKFVFIKATEADDFVDKRFNENWRGAQEQGILTGAYHFYSLRYTGEEQAENYIKNVPRGTISLPPAIDLEYSGNSKVRPEKEEFQKELNAYIKRVTNWYKKEPVIYTTYRFYRDYLGPEFADAQIWIRDIHKHPDPEKIPDWLFWQYKSRDRIDGVDGPVDANVFNGTLEELNKLVN